MQAISLVALFMFFVRFEITFAVPLDEGPSSLVRRLPSGATLFQLSKRGSLADETTGLLNQEILDAHIRYVLRKQIQGAMNFYLNTGQVLPTFNMTPYQLEDAYKSGDLNWVNGEADLPFGNITLGDAEIRIKSTVGKSKSSSNTPFARVVSKKASLPMHNLGGKDLIWAAPIQIGTPPKTFHVSIDTGSSDLFVASEKCPEMQCAGKNLYLASESMTSSQTGKTYSVGFGDGSSVKAAVVRDTVIMGGKKILNLGFGAVTQLSSQFQSSSGDTSDGLMGFGFPSLSQSKYDPFFTTLTKSDPMQGIIGTKFVGRSLLGSELTIGGVNPAAYRGPFLSLNVMAMVGQPPAFWDVEFEGASVNGRRIPIASKIATIDTGTSIIGVPQDDARAIYQSIPGSTAQSGGQFSYPCAANPRVSLQFGGRSFLINPQDMTIGKDNRGNCVGGIVGMSRQGVWLVGQVFLKNVYTAYDQRNYTVSFADLA